MKSKIHVSSSIIFAGLVSIFYQINIETMFFWMVIAGLSSYLVDIDHLILAYFIGDKKEAVKHFIINYRPSYELEEYIGYEKLRKHRNITHSSIGLLSIAASYFNPIFYPVAAGLSVHILQDLYADSKSFSY